MFVRYKTHSNATISDVKADIISLLSGNISTANDFSDICQKSNTVVQGTFPSGIYTVANATSMTFEKAHNDYANTSHYFRIQTSGNNWLSTVLARSYDSGTDTLVNGTQYPTTNTSTTFAGSITLDIIAGEKVFYIYGDIGVTKQHAILDMGKTGVTRVFIDSMLMCMNEDMYSGNNTHTGKTHLPYTYDITTEGYSAVANLYFDTSTPAKQGLANGTLFAVENPCMVYKSQTANTRHYLYGMVKPSTLSYVQGATYTDNTGAYRYFYNGYSLLAD